MKKTNNIFIQLSKQICLNISYITDCYYRSSNKDYLLSVLKRDTTESYTLPPKDFEKLMEFLKTNGYIGSKKHSKFFYFCSARREHLINVMHIYNIDYENGKIEFRDSQSYNLGKTSEEFKKFIEFMKTYKYLS